VAQGQQVIVDPVFCKVYLMPKSSISFKTLVTSKRYTAIKSCPSCRHFLTGARESDVTQNRSRWCGRNQVFDLRLSTPRALKPYPSCTTRGYWHYIKLLVLQSGEYLQNKHAQALKLTRCTSNIKYQSDQF
jgi:hypothetical protein